MPQQIVQLIPSIPAVVPGTTFTVEVIYTSGEEGDRQTTTSLTHFLHYNSDQLEFIGLTNVFENFADPAPPDNEILGNPSSEEEQDVDDGVAETDQIIFASYFDGSGNFPGTLEPVTLYTVEFEAIEGAFNGTELVNRITTDAPPGFDSPSDEDLTLQLNEAPIVANPIADLEAGEDSAINPINLLEVFEDPEDADLTYTVTNNTNEALVTPAIAQGELSLTLAENENGTAEITVQAEDTGGATVTDSFTLTVNPVNDPPEITSPTDVEVEENLTTVVTVTAEDIEEDEIRYALTGGADETRFTIDPITGQLSFNEAPDHENPNDTDKNNIYEVQVTANDGNEGTDSETFQISVTDFDLPSDFNGDGLTNMDDLAIFSPAFLSSEEDDNFDPRADLNGDRLINLDDLGRFAANFGQSDSSQFA